MVSPSGLENRGLDTCYCKTRKPTDWTKVKRKIYVGTDFHKETISIAYLTSKINEIVKEQQIKHDEGQIKKFINRLKSEYNEIHCCYKAGVTGYPLYRYLKSLGENCTLVVPGKIPIQNSDKIKTDKRDSIKLARLLRSGDLEPVSKLLVLRNHNTIFVKWTNIIQRYWISCDKK